MKFEPCWESLDHIRNSKYEQSIYSTIERIIQTPGLYIGKKSVKELWSFLGGYTYAYMEIYNYQPHFNSEFQTYIEQRLGKIDVHSWDYIISTGRTEEEAFDYFAELFRSFEIHIAQINNNGLE